MCLHAPTRILLVKPPQTAERQDSRPQSKLTGEDRLPSGVRMATMRTEALFMPQDARVLAVAGALVLWLPHSVPAQPAGAEAPHSYVQLEPVLSGPKKPLSNLFAVAPSLPAKKQQPVFSATTETQQPLVVCGTTIIPMEQNIDPGIYVRQPAGGDRHTIRRVEPPVCRQ